MRTSMGRRAGTALAGAGALGLVWTSVPSAAAIVGGKPVGDGERPFVVQLQQRDDDGSWSHYCGGALVDSRVVVTAAHCSKWAEQGKVTIRVVLGRSDATTDQGTVVTKDHFTVHSHPAFSTETNTDLGLIVLDSPARQKSASLPPLGAKPQAGRLLRAAGWGRTDLESEAKPTRLHETALPVTEFDTEGGTWDKNFVCAGTPERRVGPGDSGGPLFAPPSRGKAVVHGLVSGDTNTCPGLFTNLSDPAVWKPFRKVLAAHGLSRVVPVRAAAEAAHAAPATPATPTV
ncbi:S1 family peptidase [Streptomyces sp. NPDC017940]|uniref:S1 family peptidase n=1 Tax=Streptomyces sp. NPDC017940 TaxID=3365017 RepID=UPI0037993C13